MGLKKLYCVLIESDVEARTPYESGRPYAPACENDITIHPPSKPPQFPSIVEALIAWQRRRVFCSGMSASTSLRFSHLPSPNCVQTYDTVYAPPATVLWHDLQFQIPTECLLTVVFPQKVQTYLACWVISIFLTCFRREAPYLEDQ
jgi:hypothetical protein